MSGPAGQTSSGCSRHAGRGGPHKEGRGVLLAECSARGFCAAPFAHRTRGPRPAPPPNCTLSHLFMRWTILRRIITLQNVQSLCYQLLFMVVHTTNKVHGRTRSCNWLRHLLPAPVVVAEINHTKTSLNICNCKLQ